MVIPLAFLPSNVTLKKKSTLCVSDATVRKGFPGKRETTRFRGVTAIGLFNTVLVDDFTNLRLEAKKIPVSGFA